MYRRAAGKSAQNLMRVVGVAGLLAASSTIAAAHDDTAGADALPHQPFDVDTHATVATDGEYGRWAVGSGLSSLGGELSVRYQMSDSFALRAVGSGGAFNFTNTQDGFIYDYEITALSAGAVVDWHPFGTGFRFSGGARYNGNEVDFTIKPGRDEEVQATLLTLTSDVTTGLFAPPRVDGKVEFLPVAVYAGVGYYGQIYGSLWFSFDAGVYYQGEPDVTLTQSDLDLFTQDQSALLEVYEEQAENDLRLLAFYPLASVSISYRF